MRTACWFNDSLPSLFVVYKFAVNERQPALFKARRYAGAPRTKTYRRRADISTEWAIRRSFNETCLLPICRYSAGFGPGSGSLSVNEEKW
jgi:hypothetical protein